MSRWLIRIGIACLVMGILALSPLTELLPVGGFGIAGQPAGSNHVRVVPAQDDSDGGLALAVAGVVLLLAGRVARRRGK